MSATSGSGNRAGEARAVFAAIARGSDRRRLRHLRTGPALADGSSPARLRV